MSGSGSLDDVIDILEEDSNLTNKTKGGKVSAVGDEDYEEAENREDLHLNTAHDELDNAIQAHQDEAVNNVDDIIDSVQDQATPQLGADEKTLDYLSGNPDEVENPEVLDNEYHDDPNYKVGDRKVHFTYEYDLDRILDVLSEEDNGAFGSEAKSKDKPSIKNKYVKLPGLDDEADESLSCGCLDTVADKLGGRENYAPEGELVITEPEPEKYPAGELIIKPPRKGLSMGYSCESCGMFYDNVDAIEFFAHRATHEAIEPELEQPEMPIMEADIKDPQETWNKAPLEQKESWAQKYLNSNVAFANELYDRNDWAYNIAREVWNNQPSYVQEQLPRIMGIRFSSEGVEDKNTAIESYHKFVEQGKKEWSHERWAEQAKIFERAEELKKKLDSTEAGDFREEEHPRANDGKFSSKGGGGSSAPKEGETPSVEPSASIAKAPKTPKATKAPKHSQNFTKAMDKVKAIATSRFDDPSDYDRKRKALVDNLDGYPQHSSQLRGVGVKIKAPILKAHLSDVYPESGWSVRTEYYSGGSSINAGWTGGGPYPYGADSIRRVYSDAGATDSMVDYFDTDNYVSLYDHRKDKPQYDHGQVIYKDRGERFRDWARIRLDELGQYGASREWADRIGKNFTVGDFTGYSGIDDPTMDNLKGLYKEFETQEKKEGGAAVPREVPLATTPASVETPLSERRSGSPTETSIDPATGEPLVIDNDDDLRALHQGIMDRPIEPERHPDADDYGQLPSDRELGRLPSQRHPEGMVDVPQDMPLDKERKTLSAPDKESPKDKVERAHKQVVDQRKEGKSYMWQAGGESLDALINKLESYEGGQGSGRKSENGTGITPPDDRGIWPTTNDNEPDSDKWDDDVDDEKNYGYGKSVFSNRKSTESLDETIDKLSDE